MNKRAAVIVGVGARHGIGGAMAVKAAREGLHVFVVGRTKSRLDNIVHDISTQGDTASTCVADCTQQKDINAVFEHVTNTEMNLELVVYNVGRNMPSPFLEHDQRIIEGNWKRCVTGGMFVGQHAVRSMLGQTLSGDGKRGTIIYTGASASMRGNPMFSGFASAKGALRGMVQSMQAEFGKSGIHVSHIVIDGVINGDLVKSVKGFGKLALKMKGENGSLLPDEIAKSFWLVHSQQRPPWTNEMDLRPFKEKF